jgi:hypothetical protein
MIRAYVTEDLLGASVRVSIVQQPVDGRPESILRVLSDDPSRFRCFRWEPLTPDAAEVEPTMTLGWDEARAVLDGLTRFFQGAEDTRALRKDYDAERARVDALTAVLADVSRTLAGGDFG